MIVAIVVVVDDVTTPIDKSAALKEAVLESSVVNSKYLWSLS